MVAVAGANGTSFALSGNGEVWGWGRNVNGQVAVDPYDTTAHTTPVKMPGVGNMVAIAAYSERGYGLKADGTVWGWSRGEAYQIPGIGGLTAISPAARMGLKADGTAWGLDVTSGPDSGMSQIPGISGVRAISDNAVMLTTSGEVWTYGKNPGGFLGDGVPSGADAVLVHVRSIKNATAIGGGTGFYAVADVDPSALTLAPVGAVFPDRAVGTTSPATAFTLANGTTATVGLAQITISGGFLRDGATTTCGASLAPGASCAIGVSFAPTAVGPYAASLQITDDLGRVVRAPLSGAGVSGPQLAIGAASLAFGERTVGSISAPQTTTLRNTGTTAATLTGITSDGDFAQTNDCPPSLAAGGSCTITVTFTPTATGARTGTLQITSDTPGSPLRVGLTGTGVVAPTLSLMPTQLTFADQALASQSSMPAVVTVTNTGTGSANFASIALSGADGSDFVIAGRTCDSPLAPNASCTITVAFKPARGTEPVLRADRAAALTIREATQPTALTAPLSGRAVPPPLMYVHGITTPARLNNAGVNGIGFPTIYNDGLLADYSSGNWLQIFEYYQDASRLTGDGCSGVQSPMPHPDAAIPIPTIADESTEKCDSQSDLGTNAAMLYTDMVRLYNRTGQQRRITLVCHSMGCGVTRGFLAYAAEKHARNAADPGPDDLVESVTQIEGAVSGSALATALYSVHSVNDPFDPNIPVELRQQAALTDTLRLVIKQGANNIDADRPAVSGLRPDSPYYAWARRQPAAGAQSSLPAVDYYTFYGDIRLVLNLCYFGCHVPGTDIPIGDLIMLPGAPAPYGTQASGGARFSAPSGNSWEWGMRRDIAYYSTNLRPVDLPANGNAVREIFSAPENHLNFGNGQTGAPQVDVANCQTGHAQKADAQLLELLRARLAGQGYRCGQP